MNFTILERIEHFPDENDTLRAANAARTPSKSLDFNHGAHT